MSFCVTISYAACDTTGVGWFSYWGQCVSQHHHVTPHKYLTIITAVIIRKSTARLLPYPRNEGNMKNIQIVEYV